LADFRRELKAAQCAWRNEISVTKRPGAEPPRFELGAGGDGCRAPAEPEELAGDERATAACLGAAPTERTLEFCRRTVFHDRVSALLPPALLLTVGEANPVLATIPVGPALLAALTVTGVAVFGVWLVGRPVLRPVTALVAASRRLAAGERADPVPVRGRDEIAGLTASFNHMAQALRRSEEQQRRMIADIAHELRTPLVNIRGYLEALKDGVVRGDPALYEELYEEALHQQQLIDDIQLLALADSGGLRQRADPVDLGDLVTAATTRHHAVATEAGITLESTVDSPSPVVLGDEKRLRQVLGNLIGNAVRATPPDGRITVSARCEGEQAVLVVADTGTGIREEDLPLVFERFWRADESRDRATGGSGLGLAIAREIVTAHGGTISVASPGGAVFTVRLPAVTGQAAGRPGLTASP
ncbi:sensor histidine kinase, partial [Crossiella equi]